MPSVVVRLFVALFACLLLCCPFTRADAPVDEDFPLSLSRSAERWTGDLEGMLERRMIRVLVPYSRTLFFNDQGQERGVTAEIAREFESWLNRKYQRQLGKRPLTVYLIPTTRDRLLPALAEGLGDIAAGNLTVTPARRTLADFVIPPELGVVRELVATGPGAPMLDTLDDLSGKTVHVRAASSYAESLATLNTRLVAAGRAPVTIVALPDALEDEDKLEMLNAGLLQIVVIDDWLARIWRTALPQVTIRDDLVLRSDGHTGWGIRQASPGLATELSAFFAGLPHRADGFAVRMAQFQRRFTQLHNNTHSTELRRFEATLHLFDKYGDRYGFDPLMLAAQGYQESRLRQDARSRSGAIGVMQVMPATGRELKVGDITQIEPNIHAGTKYMSTLMSKHFADATFSEFDRPLFAFASYNAGPNAIARLRRLAAQRGLDPNQWFNHVEVIVAEKIGLQTTTYVRNICKYYVAYKLINAARASRGELGISGS